MRTHKWTPQETRTMQQNLHIKPTVLTSVIPNKTCSQIARKRRYILDGNLPLDLEQRQRVADSLKQRRWSTQDRVLYIRAASGCKASREQLINRGLWYNGTGKGGR